MAAIATGTAVEGAGQGFMGLLDCLDRPLGAAPRRGQRRRGRTRLHPARRTATSSSSTPRRACACRSPSWACRPRPPAASCSPPLMGWQQAARVLLTSDWVGADRAGRARPGPAGVRPGHRARRDGRPGGAHRRPPPRRHPGQHARSMRAARRDAVLEANRREQAAFATLARRPPSAAAPWPSSPPGPPPGPDRAPGHHRRPDRPRPGPGRARPPPSRSSASTRSTCPSTPTFPCARTRPPRSSTACASTTTSAASTRWSRWPPPPRSPRASGSAPASCWPRSTSRSCWPSRWPRSTTSPGAGSPSGSGSAGTAPRPRTTASTGARRHDVVREHLAAMEAIWSTDQAEYHGEFVDFGPTWSWPKPVQQPRVRTLVGGGANDAVFAAVVECADGWIPIGGSGLAQAIPRLHALAEEAGRDPAALSRRPLRHHRRRGQARALRRAGHHRGGAPRPGR